MKRWLMWMALATATGGAPLCAGTGNEATAGGPAIRADSTKPDLDLVLLPGRTSGFERALWGRDGLLRTAGIAAPLTIESRRSELGLRRAMLTSHQIAGFVTLGLMAASAVYGQRVVDGDINASDAHSKLTKLTIGAYGVTALMAVLSPPPLIRREETSTITLHKTLAWIHVAGMVLTPILGKLVWKFDGPQNRPTLVVNRNMERFHLVSGYLTTATYAASLAVITF